MPSPSFLKGASLLRSVCPVFLLLNVDPGAHASRNIRRRRFRTEKVPEHRQIHQILCVIPVEQIWAELEFTATVVTFGIFLLVLDQLDSDFEAVGTFQIGRDLLDLTPMFRL